MIMNRPRLLDLFCGAGGAGMGYHRAGYEVTGVDIRPQKHYPFKFIQGDALEYLYKHGHEYDVIHASPPCQAYTVSKSLRKNDHPMLIKPVRELLQMIGKPYIIENVPGAKLHMVSPLMLCGTMFGLRTIRHRLFECNPPIYFAPFTCRHDTPSAPMGRQPNREREFISVVGNFTDVAYARVAMGIDWMTQKELAESIPPAYTEWLGKQILGYLAKTHA